MILRLLKRNLSFVTTVAVCVILYLAASIHFSSKGETFASWDTLLLFFSENPVVGIAAIGMTFVILSGGIDLSVGSVVGFVSIFMAILVQEHQVASPFAILLCLLVTTTFGAGMGSLIHFFQLPAFLITLAGMFLVRGAAFLLSEESIGMGDHIDWLASSLTIPMGKMYILPARTVIFLIVFVVAIIVAHFTPFGRTVYAIGGNEQSALLMGLPVARTKIGIYALSGFCAGLAGVVNVLYTSSGNPTHGAALELDAISAVVIGGTLLSGGVGYVAGTLVGVLTMGIIQVTIQFANLNTWWTRIVVGALLLTFILLQKVIQPKRLAGH